MSSILCQFCGKLVDDPKQHNDNNGHCLKNINLEEKQCDICGIKVKNNKNLNSHKALHLSEYFQCLLCHSIFKQKRYLVRHMIIHSDILHTCSICNMKFNNKSNLLRHKLIHESKLHKCNECKKMFHRKSYLKLHMITIKFSIFVSIVAHGNHYNIFFY